MEEESKSERGCAGAKRRWFVEVNKGPRGITAGKQDDDVCSPDQKKISTTANQHYDQSQMTRASAERRQPGQGGAIGVQRGQWAGSCQSPDLQNPGAHLCTFAWGCRFLSNARWGCCF